MTGLEPVIHWAAKDWMGGTRPPMVRRLKHRRFRVNRKGSRACSCFFESGLRSYCLVAQFAGVGSGSVVPTLTLFRIAL
jgi:hypothetical protein